MVSGSNAGMGAVSVVIPVYNNGEYLGRTLDSVLGQSWPVSEVVIVDDGSTDNSRDVAERYSQKDERVRYIYQDNAGASAARNVGVRAANGKWIAFLDADDEWLTDKIKLQMGVLQRNKQLGWVAGNYYRCDCSQGCKREDMQEDVPAEKVDYIDKQLLQGGEYFDDLLSVWRCHTIGWTGTMLIKRKLLLEAGLFREGLKRMNDLDMWLRVSYIAGAIGYVKSPIAVYHTGVQGSIIKKHFEAGMVIDFINRHKYLAKKYGRQEAFDNWVAVLVRYWIKYMQQYGKGRDMRELLRHYGGLFSRHYCRSKMIASFWPGAALLYDRIRK